MTTAAYSAYKLSYFKVIIMLFRNFCFAGLTAILQVGTSVSVANESATPCNSLEDFTSDNSVIQTCKRFFEEDRYKGYMPYSITEAENVAKNINQVLENTKHKKVVFFISEKAHMTSPINIKDVDFAFVGVVDDEGHYPYIVLDKAPFLANKGLGSIFRFESSERELLLKDIRLNDVNIHMGEKASKFRKFDPVNSGLVDIESAKSVTFDNVFVKSSFHKQAVNFSCNSKLPIASSTQVKIVNSTLSMPAQNARGIEFKCDNKLHTFNNQVAFNLFYMQTTPVSEVAQTGSSDIKVPGNQTTTASPVTGTALPTPPEADIGIFIDIEGKINFSESACNNLKFKGVGSADRSVQSRQALFKSARGEFGGVLALIESDGLKGTFFAPQEAVFKQRNYCMPRLTAYSQAMIHRYLPTAEEVRSLLNNEPPATESDSNSQYWKEKYFMARKSVHGLIAVAAVEGVAIIVMGVLLHKYRSKAQAVNPLIPE